MGRPPRPAVDVSLFRSRCRVSSPHALTLRMVKEQKAIVGQTFLSAGRIGRQEGLPHVTWKSMEPQGYPCHECQNDHLLDHPAWRRRGCMVLVRDAPNRGNSQPD